MLKTDGYINAPARGSDLILRLHFNYQPVDTRLGLQSATRAISTAHTRCTKKSKRERRRPGLREECGENDEGKSRENEQEKIYGYMMQCSPQSGEKAKRTRTRESRRRFLMTEVGRAEAALANCLSRHDRVARAPDQRRRSYGDQPPRQVPHLLPLAGLCVPEPTREIVINDGSKLYVQQ
jgi:hypothetical protein